MLGAALLSAGTSLLSGIFGQSSAKKQARKEEEAIRKANDAATANAAQMNKEIRARADAAALVPVQTSHETLQISQGGVDMQAFMRAAEENGFNPLTFLRSGALSLFSNQVGYTDDFTCTTGERAMDAALSGTYLPQLSPVIANTRVPGTGEIFGNALTAGVNQYLAGKNQQDQNDFQMNLLNRQLFGAQQPGSYTGSRFGSVPSAKLTGGTTKSVGDCFGGENGPTDVFQWPSIAACVAWRGVRDSPIPERLRRLEAGLSDSAMADYAKSAWDWVTSGPGRQASQGNKPYEGFSWFAPGDAGWN